MADAVNSLTPTSGELDPVLLTQELQVAKDYIKDLEARLEKRENELRFAEKKVKRSFRMKNRRMAALLAPKDLNINRTSTAPANEGSSKQQQLGEYIKLTIISCEPDGMPMYVRSYIGRSFIVSPWGATIGCHDQCGIKLPSDTGVREKHAVVKSRTNEDDGLREYYITNLMNETKFSGDNSTSKTLYTNTTFKTAGITWNVSPLDPFYMLQCKLFASVRKNLYSQFLSVLEDIRDWNEKSTIQNDKKFIVDLRADEDETFAVSFDKSINKICCYVTDSKGSFKIIHVIVDYKRLDFLKVLLKLDVNVNQQCGNKSYTPLHIACKHNDINMVKILLQHGADICIRDSNGNLSVNMAEEYQITKMLLLSNYFCLAACNGDYQEVQHIITSSSNFCIDVKGFKGFTALHLACMNAHYDIVVYLLQNQANMHIKCEKYQRTSLHYACIADNARIVEILLNYGASSDILDSQGLTSIDLIQSIQVCNLLYKGEKTLCLAVQINDISLIKEILIESTIEKTFNITPDILQKNISAGKYGRKTSKKMIFKNLGLCALVDQKNKQGLGPLHLAASQGNIEILQLLLSYGAKIDLPGGLEKQTALFFACFAGHSDCVRFLLMIGADKEFCDARGMQCIDYIETKIKLLDDKLNEREDSPALQIQTQGFDASVLPQHKHCFNVCNSLIDVPSELRIQLDRFYTVLNVLHSGQQKLYNALKDDDVDALERLLSEEEVDINGMLSKTLPITALHYASSLGMDRAVNILLTYDANPYLHDNQSYTPMHVATQHGYLDIVKAFLKFGVDIDIQTGIQRLTCLHIATIKKERKMVEVLLDNGADKTLKDIEGKTAFSLATNKKIQVLLASGDEQLYVALKYDHYEAIKILIGFIDVNTNFQENVTPLHIACEKGSLVICELLINKGARINVLGGPDDCAPLHNACRSFSTEVVQLLLLHGADLTLTDNKGLTAFEVSSNNDIRKTLIHANKKKPQLQTVISKEDVCVICRTNEVNTMVMPCQHTSFCSECVSQLTKCALDRQTITDVVLLSEHNS